MEPTVITLTVANGPLAGQEYVFREPAVYVLGRAEECFPRLPDDCSHKDISRHHCLLSVNPPEVWVQDLGSRNGTYVNGKKVGQREGRPLDGDTPPLQASGRERLRHGDELALGRNTVLRIGVHVLEEVAV